ncbi:MAG: family N-acetyltransferase [Rhizobium sp.]|nr:family N-acetyltransferase [Rhizobium sp.]
MQVRPYQTDDAARLAIIFYRSVRVAGLKAYSQHQVEAWAVSVPPASFYEQRAGDGRILLVTINADGEPIAYGDLERSGHIDHLFCIPEAIGTGAASALYDRLESAAHEWGLGRLFVEASELARPLFARKGFETIARNDFMMRGAMIYNYQMEKFLRR